MARILTAAQKAAAAKAAAAKKKKDDAYAASFANPITSQNDPRIAINAGLNPEMLGMMTSAGTAPSGATPPMGVSPILGDTNASPAGVPGGVPSDVTLVSTETDEYGNVVGIYSDSTTKILIPSGKKYKSTVDEIGRAHV